MRVKISSSTGSQNYVGTNDRNQTVLFSGEGEHVSPMESLLMSSATCSAIDIEMILHKMRQPLDRISVDVVGERASDHPKIFTSIHLHYVIYGKVKSEKVQQAIELSMTKYCSVSIMISKSCPITTSFEIAFEQ
jgi:putative redox protein